MRHFDYSFLKTAEIPSDILGTAIGLGRLMERSAVRREEFPEVYSDLEGIARMQSVKESNAIEGIATSDERIASLIRRVVEPVGHDEEEIAGYVDALDLIHTDHSRIAADEAFVKSLHMVLMSHVGNPAEPPGEYKRENNVIIEIDASGRRSIRFRPLSAEDTPEAMEQIMLALADAMRDHGIDRLLLIPCFVLDFLSIHPFADGNGRMSRLLSLLLYYKSGIDVGKYISFEERISSSKQRYYWALPQSSAGWHEGTNDYVPFIRYYLDVLFQCYRDLDSRFATVAGKKVNKSNRVEAAVLSSILPISKAEILAKLPDVSETTAEAVLSKLMREGRIEKIGGNRNAKYRRKSARLQNRPLPRKREIPGVPEHIERGPDPSGPDLHPPAEDLHRADVAESLPPQRVHRPLKLVRVRNVSAYPATVPEVGVQVIQSLLDVGNVGGYDVGTVELYIRTPRIPDLVRPMRVEPGTPDVLKRLPGVLLVELHGMHVPLRGDGLQQRRRKPPGARADLDDAVTALHVALVDYRASVLRGDDLRPSVERVGEFPDAGAEHVEPAPSYLDGIAVPGTGEAGTIDRSQSAQLYHAGLVSEPVALTFLVLEVEGLALGECHDGTIACSNKSVCRCPITHIPSSGIYMLLFTQHFGNVVFHPVFSCKVVL